MYFKEEAGIGGKTVIGGERVLEGRGAGIGSWGTSFGGKVRVGEGPRGILEGLRAHFV